MNRGEVRTVHRRVVIEFPVRLEFDGRAGKCVPNPAADEVAGWLGGTNAGPLLTYSLRLHFAEVNKALVIA